MALRRRVIMQGAAPSSDLYPIGTDICDYYNFKSTAVSNTDISTSTGELITSATAAKNTSELYAEINQGYTYAKKRLRLYTVAYYDDQYAFISATSDYNNTTEGSVVENIPINAKYVRITMYHTASSSWDEVGLVRTA